MCSNAFNLSEIEITEDMETFQTLQTRIGHNATQYHNLNVLPPTLLYIFCQHNMIWRGADLK